MTHSEPQPRVVGTRLLVRGVNWLGDAVMTTPALLRLREANPQASITLLTSEKLAALWQGHSALDQVVTFTAQENAFQIARRLRAQHFEVGLILPNSLRSALELWWAGVPERIGYAGQLRSWLLTRALARPTGLVPMHKRSKREVLQLQAGHRAPQVRDRSGCSHHLHQYLHLTAALGGNPQPLAPRLFVSECEIVACLDRFKLERSGARPLFGLNPGAEYGPAKRWPAEAYVAAAAAIQERTQCTWLVLGGARDIELAQEVTSGIGRLHAKEPAKPGAGPAAINLAGATSLRELCALLQACRVLLTNDSGPMHVAAALETPVVALFGSTAAELTAPGLPGDPRHRLLSAPVPCAPCFLRECPVDFRCMRGIAVAEVVQAVWEVFER